VIDGMTIAIPYNYAGVYYDPTNPQIYMAELLDFCGLTRTSEHNIAFWHLLRYLIAHSIVILREMRPLYQQVGKILLRIRNADGYQTQHKELHATFSEIFPNVEFDVFEDPTSRDTPIIKIYEGERDHELQESAAGYFEVLYILSQLRSISDDDILLIDEPALHLHPLKIRYFGRKMAAFARREVILFTHSPYFVNTSLFSSTQCLIKIHKDRNGPSRILSKHEKEKGFSLGIKPYHFKAEIFFSKCNVFVEGPSDAYALTAISDALDNVFEENDILVIDSGGKDVVHKYIGLIEAYELPHVAMVDHDYLSENRRKTADFTILPGRLEDELVQLDAECIMDTSEVKCSNKKSTSIDAIRAYELVFNKMNTDREKVKNTNLGTVFNNALAKAGISKPEDIWKR
jgi:hypothetical protein